MANIASTDVTYTITSQKKLEDSRKIVHATLAFGDGALTYPAGGIPVLKGSLGCPYNIDAFKIFDTGGSGYTYEFDKANSKIRIFQSAAAAAHSHNLTLKNAAVADGASARVNAGTNLLGANTGSDITIAGGGANGGIATGGAISAVGLSEVSTVAIAAQTIKVEVIGY
jgi:hypothetical protein